MHAQLVLAHPEPASYNAHLASVAREALESDGWSVGVTDLYAAAFDPCEGPRHYRDRLEVGRFDAQAEQRHASMRGTLPPEVVREIESLDRTDLLILQYPMWWHLPPAILKGWMDRVFVYGEVYTSGQRFENGRFRGRRALLSVTVGTSEATYAHDGRSGDIDLLLWPVHFTLAYVGYSVLRPWVSYGVEAALRYSDPEVVAGRLAANAASFAAALASLETREAIPFNRMAEWDADGRIRADAPVYSPFMRRRKAMPLE